MAQLKENILCPDVSLSLPCWLSQFSWGNQQGRDRATKKIIGPILLSYYKKSLISSNLNSKPLRFHCVRPNVQFSFQLNFSCEDWRLNVLLFFCSILNVFYKISNFECGIENESLYGSNQTVFEILSYKPSLRNT